MKDPFFKLLLINLLLFSCNNHYPLKLGGKYILDIDGNSQFCIIDSQNTSVVNSAVVEYNYDSRYIIVKQKPVDVILSKSYLNSSINLEKRKKMLEESNIIYYWIIDKTTGSIYGPSLKSDYMHKRTILNVPSNLELRKL